VQVFSLYYFLVCILGLNILFTTSLIKKKSLKNLSFFILFIRFSILSVVFKLLYIYLPLQDYFKLKVNILEILSTNAVSVKLTNFEFPLLYDLDIFYDLGLEPIDNNFLTCNISFFFITLGSFNNKLLIFFILSYIKLPLYT
jgi:hypothetical protein